MDYTFICIIIDAPYTNSYEKKTFHFTAILWPTVFVLFWGPCKQKNTVHTDNTDNELKRAYVGSNRLYKKITLGTLSELLVGKLRILKVLESLFVREAQTRLHLLPLPLSRAPDRLFGGYFR